MQIQMARELGLNPRKFGKLANEKQEPWKKPLPEFIEEIYLKRFKKKQPDVIKSIEQLVQDQREKKAERKARKSASSSCTADRPYTTMTASPMNFSINPPYAWAVALQQAKHKSKISFTSSGINFMAFRLMPGV
jgi:hypothetical protein